MRKLQATELRKEWPRHCKTPMSPDPGDGIWECTRCDRWVHFPSGLPEEVRGRDLEKFNVAYDQLMS